MYSCAKPVTLETPTWNRYKQMSVDRNLPRYRASHCNFTFVGAKLRGSGCPTTQSQLSRCVNNVGQTFLLFILCWLAGERPLTWDVDGTCRWEITGSGQYQLTSVLGNFSGTVEQGFQSTSRSGAGVGGRGVRFWDLGGGGRALRSGGAVSGRDDLTFWDFFGCANCNELLLLPQTGKLKMFTGVSWRTCSLGFCSLVLVSWTPKLRERIGIDQMSEISNSTFGIFEVPYQSTASYTSENKQTYFEFPTHFGWANLPEIN